MGNYDQAIADLNKAIEIDPASGQLYNRRGGVYRDME